jgi:hydrogenase nickel incorporation protein HypB
MCGTCGCGQGEKRVEDLHPHQAHDHAGHGHSHEHGHDHAHWHEHSHTHPDGTRHAHSHSHEHEYSRAHAHVSSHQHTRGDDAAAGETRLLSVERDILARNDAIAAENRRALQAAKTLALNLVSSPGSGKTALLVETLRRIGDKYPLAVIEGDQETTADADRIRATGVPAIQINTGKGCHLDADLVRTAMARLGTPANGILFIENVGNLVCPAGFDLGEAHKVVIVSVTEGEDKPLKYSDMFAASALMVVTKTDLLPHLDIDIDRLVENARRINPTIGVLKLSAKSGEGMDRWIHWLETARALRLATD